MRCHNPTLTTSMLLAALLIGSSASAIAAPQSFESLWQRIEANSPAQKSAESASRGAEVAAKRAARHWLPSVNLSGRVYNTNDPAMTFMSELGQRQIQAPDFTPGTLNSPGSSTFGQATLGLDLPLYEGGSGVAAHDSAVAVSDSKQSMAQATRSEEYAAALVGYSSLLSYRAAGRDLEDLAGIVSGTLARYRIGTRANPIGRSGLLGLQALQNRIELVRQDLGARTDASRSELSTLAGIDPQGWAPQAASAPEFVRAHSPSSPAGVSSRTRAAEKLADSSASEVRVARAASLPRVGLFTEGNLTTGSRSTGTSYAAGAYVSWNLFAPKTTGAAGEAQLASDALREQAAAARQQDQIALEGSESAIRSLDASWPLLKKSSELLGEQTRTGQRLFVSGTINALQLTELYSRRLDLIEAKLKAEIEYAKAYGTVITHSAAGVPHGQR